ncbi:hypothetical protein ACLSU7_02300 [Bdellovibrio sp. HCB185ZH]|uniref:hypothetical protein n=1 Tax=Bdellovibrio sp. HCB185ZH TaxID=3394235 RepID=UPI0039A76B9E
MGVGFLHGYLPQGISRDYVIRPTKVRILVTDESLFPKSIQEELENDLRIKFEVTVTRDWNSIQAKVIASPSQDILLLPSYWAHTMNRQNLLFVTSENSLSLKIAPDFLDPVITNRSLYFYPLYWMKTGFKTTGNASFEDFLKDKKATTLFLLNDEDLLLNHFQIWQDKGWLALVQQKKILTLPLDRLVLNDKLEGASELPLNESNPDLTVQDDLSALLVWGAAIPAASDKKELAIEILTALTANSIQEQNLMKTPFNSTLQELTTPTLPPQRRATHIRELKLKGTILIGTKNLEAPKKLRDEFNLIL